MMAAKKGNVRIVRKLIKHGANTKLTNKVNYSSLQIVAHFKHYEVINPHEAGMYNVDIVTSSASQVGRL